MKPKTFTPKAFMLITYFFFFVKLSSTEFIHQGFDSGTVAPPGWLIKAAGTYTSASGSGQAIPSLKLSNNGDFVETPEFSGATECSFMIKGYSIDSLSSLNVFSYNGIKWSRIDSIHHITSSKKIIIKPLTLSAKKIRFVFHKSKGNLAFDDLIVKNNEVKPDSTPPVFLKEPKFSYNTEATAEFQLSISKPGKVYFLITSENCNIPAKAQLLNPLLYDTTCLIIAGNYNISVNTDTIIKISNLIAGTKYTVYWLAAYNGKTFGQNDFYAVNFSFPKTNYNLFFSEINKGSGNNKAIEIFNPSTDTAYLKNYRIAMSYNGGGWKTTYYKFPPTAKLDPNEVFVILKSNADTNVVKYSVANDLSCSSLLGFTGNDAMGLQVTNDNGASWRFIDVFGYPDSNFVFDVAGVKAAAGKSNLIRKKYIQHGNTNWKFSAGTDEKSSEWVVLAQNDFTNLGFHKMELDTTLYFTDIVMENQEKSPFIDSVDHIIYFTLHSESDLKNLMLSYKIMQGVSISPDPAGIKDFSVLQKFVLANIGQTITTEWSIVASVDDAPEISSLNIIDVETGKIKITLTESVKISKEKPVISLFEKSSGQPFILDIKCEQDFKVIIITSLSNLIKDKNYTLIIDSITDEYNNISPSYEFTFTVPPANNINQPGQAQVQIFPNPSKDYVIIKNQDKYFKDFIEATIYSLDGRVAFSRKFKDEGQTKLDIGNLKSGAYILMLNDNVRKTKVYLLKSK